ncbi:HlyD family secretion protein [Marinobacterium sedimentorum]|uniref:HlyD family secretion protein n=1 Tax=Marinobacterium sedimentorum TaxID=2927804 RepID=UPI0020C6190E|nr:HlyD family secretion protein [Marinobacterium sedimentorum]
MTTRLPQTDNTPPPRRRFAGISLRTLLMVVIPLLAVAIASLLYLRGGRYLETDNAYLKADKAPISSEVSGTVLELNVRDNAAVSKGDLLFQLDATEFQTSLHRAQAQLAAVTADIQARRSGHAEKQAQINLARTDLDYWQREADRQEDLARKGAISRARLDEARHNADMARQREVALKLELQRIADELAGGPDTPIEDHPDYRIAKAELQQAQRALEQTAIRAPMDGHISQLPKPGQFLERGKIAAILIGNRLWIEANFIEADLAKIAPGQPVRINFDSFPDQQWQGSVDSLSPATGAEFAVIPAQNATGNWVKIPQRVPVRIQLENPGDELRAGLSALIQVDTGTCRLQGACS